jgi:hypothetical protein
VFDALPLLKLPETPCINLEEPPGKLNVVDPSPEPYVVEIAANSAA